MVASKKDERTARELFLSCHPILDNDFFVRLIDQSPTPNAVDEQMRRLGWPNQIAQMASDAAKLKHLLLADADGKPQKNADDMPWWRLTENKARPAKRMFRFIDRLEIDPLYGMTTDQNEHRVRSQTSMLVGGQEFPVSGPYLVRELMKPTGSELFFTTYDGSWRDGYLSLHEKYVEQDDLTRRCYCQRTPIAWLHDELKKGRLRNERDWHAWLIHFIDEPGSRRPEATHLEIAISRLIYKPAKMTFSRIVKEIEISQRIRPKADSKEYKTIERLRVYIYTDMGPVPQLTVRGHMVYEEIAPIRFHHVNHADPREIFADIFRVCYDIDTDWNANLILEGSDRPNLNKQTVPIEYLDMTVHDSRYGNEFTGDGSGLCHPSRFYENAHPTLDMEKIIGVPFLKDPPKGSLRTLLIK